MRGLPWLLGLGLALGLGLLHLHPRADALRESAEPLPDTQPEERDASVLIVEVESRELLERLRRRLPRARIVVSERDVVGIEGCLFAYDLEAVNGPLNRLGWGNRRIELVTRSRGPEAASLGGSESASAPNLLAELARKPELTSGDARALLRELDGPGSR